MALHEDERIMLYMLSVKLDPANVMQHLTRDEWLSRITSIAVHDADPKVKLDALDKIGKAEGWYKPPVESARDPAIMEWVNRVLADELPLAAVPVYLKEAVAAALPPRQET